VRGIHAVFENLHAHCFIPLGSPLQPRRGRHLPALPDWVPPESDNLVLGRVDRLVGESSYVFKAMVTQIAVSNEPGVRPGPG
jgi:hypothetical protein